MKVFIQTVVLALLLVVLGVLLAPWLQGRSHDSVTQHSHTGPTLQQIQMLSAIVTTRVDVADVQETTIRGYSGAIRAVLLTKGDLLLSVDLSQAKLEDVDTSAKKAVLLLPAPEVTSPRLDHERTRLFTIGESGLWQIVPGDAAQVEVVNRALKEAQQVVARAGEDKVLFDRARRQAEIVLGCFFQAMGWAVTIQWVD